MATRKTLTIGIVIISIVAISIQRADLSRAAPQTIILVTTLADTQTNADGKCSLREAIINANNDDQSGSTNCSAGEAGVDSIHLPVGTIVLGSALPLVTSDLAISGIASGSTIDGANSYRILKHDANETTLTLYDLTLKNGNAGNLNGGGVENFRGSLEVHGCTFHNNQAYNGGAIHNVGTNVLVKNSTFVQNSADHPTNLAFGGAVRNGSGFSFTITNSTFNLNSAKTSGSTLSSSSGIIFLRNSIVAFGENHNCNGVINDEGNNIDTGMSCGFGSTKGSMYDTDPLFGAFGSHGGPTDTILLAYGSPAIDGVTYNSPNSSDGWDQRRFVRPVDGDGDGISRYDIGAFESDTVWKLIYLPIVTK